MARLPEVAVDRVQGERPSTATVAVGDLGLHQLAQSVGQVAQVAEQADAERAQQALVGVRTSFDGAFKKAAESYDGRVPGFAQDQMAAYDATVAATRGGLSASVQRKFDKANLTERLSIFDQASSVETGAQGQVLKQARDADQKTRVLAMAAGFQVDTQKAVTDDWSKGDPTAPDFLDKQLAAFDARSAQALDAARPEDRPDLQLELANQRANLMAKSSAGQVQLIQARAATNTRVGLGALVNGVTSDATQYESALKTAATLVDSSHLDAQTKQGLKDALPGDLAAAAMQGMREREDWHGIKGALVRFKKVLRPDDFSRFSGQATQALTSEQRQLAGVTADGQISSELASIRETGQGAGFDPSSLLSVYGPVDGPAKVMQATQAISDAKAVYAAVGDAAGLSAKDLGSRLDSLKPPPGDPDFARKQAVYEQASATAQKLVALRQTDPALAVQADKASAALWQKAQDGAPASARAWATDTLSRQAALGIPDAARRVLPLDAAKTTVKSFLAKDPIAKGEAMASLWAYTARFGDEQGRVLGELQRAGLPPNEVALVNATDGDPVTADQYARALARLPQIKMNPSDTSHLEAQVDLALKPYADSWGGSGDGEGFAQALRQSVLIMAKATMADGHDPNAAAKAAARQIVQRYTFDRAGFRMPVEVAAQPVKIVRGALGEFSNPKQKVEGALSSAVSHKTSERPGDEAAHVGALRTLRDVVLEPGRLAAPGPESWLTQGQKAARYADQIAKQGKWFTADDDKGLRLMLPSVRGGYEPVLDAKGQPISLTWDAAFKRAGDF